VAANAGSCAETGTIPPLAARRLILRSVIVHARYFV